MLFQFYTENPFLIDHQSEKEMIIRSRYIGFIGMVLSNNQKACICVGNLFGFRTYRFYLLPFKLCRQMLHESGMTLGTSLPCAFFNSLAKFHQWHLLFGHSGFDKFLVRAESFFSLSTSSDQKILQWLDLRDCYGKIPISRLQVVRKDSTENTSSVPWKRRCWL